MKYRVTCLTPLLVGDGDKLSPIDYMVWKDHVNVLDQNRIFRLLAKGPRLDGYLVQIKKAEKLDFASWGGFAQNFADRRIPFEHSTMSKFWERAYSEHLSIPTFASGVHGPFLPASALKGALRTGVLYSSVREGALKSVMERFTGDRFPRRPAEAVEDEVLGRSGNSRLRFVRAGDSGAVDRARFKVYLSRVAVLVQQRGSVNYALGWKQSPRGSVEGRNPDESTPAFAEMAVPGTTFEGSWQERGSGPRGKLFVGANQYAARLLALQKGYAQAAGLGRVVESLTALEERLGSLKQDANCLLSLGWGGGLMGKTAWLDKDQQDYRAILGKLPFYSRAINSGMPFPKTRRILFENNQPSTTAGWVLLEVAD
jgi:CRISPR-associated protein Csm5